MKKILVIGQIPPPYHGQALMIARLVNANFEDVKIYHVRMSFSKSAKSIGKPSIAKFFHVFHIIYKAILYKFKYKINVLYYPPAGPNLSPIIRDLLILAVIRPFFRHTVYHFRAAGISEYLQKCSFAFRKLAFFIYRKPSVSIQLSALNPADGKYFQSKEIVVIRNGLEDAAISYLPIKRSKNEVFNILYIGLLRESKGVLVLLKAIKKLLIQGYKIHLDLVGDFISEEFEETFKKYCKQEKLGQYINLAGVKTGSDKWDYFVKADALCFPTFFEAESFGNVSLEAMMFELPIVTTKWRAIPDIVEEQVTGLLAEPKDAASLAEKIEFLIQNPDIARNMGQRGRDTFLKTYTLDKHLESMRALFTRL
ncbi:MAG: glycosyltransferase family 4 protein [Thermonemataceae bacterium]